MKGTHLSFLNRVRRTLSESDDPLRPHILITPRGDAFGKTGREVPRRLNQKDSHCSPFPRLQKRLAHDSGDAVVRKNAGQQWNDGLSTEFLTEHARYIIRRSTVKKVARKEAPQG